MLLTVPDGQADIPNWSGGSSTLRLGRLCGRSCITRISGALGEFAHRPAVTTLSAPPSGRLATEWYPSKSSLILSVSCQLPRSPYSEVTTLRSMVLLTISGWKLAAVTPVTTPLLTVALLQPVPTSSVA